MRISDWSSDVCSSDLATAICGAVEAMRVQHMGRELPPVTASIGAATFPADGNNSEALMHAADEGLYRAKHGGPNRRAHASVYVAVVCRLSRLRRHPAGRCHPGEHALQREPCAVDRHAAPGPP